MSSTTILINSLSSKGKARLLSYRGEVLLERSFGEQVLGRLYLMESCLYEVLECTRSGQILQVSPVLKKDQLDIYLDAVDLSGLNTSSLPGHLMN